MVTSCTVVRHLGNEEPGDLVPECNTLESTQTKTRETARNEIPRKEIPTIVPSEPNQC